MFTGIVEELGTVESIEDQGDAIRLTLRSHTVLEDAKLGDSIAVNGCCLTVAARTEDTWTADVMQETLDKTSLYGVVPGDTVNPLDLTGFVMTKAELMEEVFAAPPPPSPPY